MASADILRAAHTPLPWRYYPGDPSSVYSGDGRVYIVQRADDLYCSDDEAVPEFDEAEANAAFIVRACNAHYQMLEALKEAASALDEQGRRTGLRFPSTEEVIRAAIAAAEAEAGR